MINRTLSMEPFHEIYIAEPYQWYSMRCFDFEMVWSCSACSKKSNYPIFIGCTYLSIRKMNKFEILGGASYTTILQDLGGNPLIDLHILNENLRFLRVQASVNLMAMLKI